MSIKKNMKLLILLICSIIVLMIYYTDYYKWESFTLIRILGFQEISKESSIVPGFVISQPQCKMLDPDPWDESIEKYLDEPRFFSCSRIPLLTYIELQDNFTNEIKINKNVISKYKEKPNHSLKCCFNTISRRNQNAQDYNITADSLYELSNCTDFYSSALLPNDTEFLLVNCESISKGKNNGVYVYKDVHPVVPMLPEVSVKIRNAKATPKRLNFIILGIDSMSKLNLRRTMPRTLKYLQESKWIELNGYNKIGENTFPNLMAILSGEPMRSLEEKCLANRSQKMDDCPFIWKDFNKKGYVTLYAEDTPSISTFNFLRTGFVEKPTDYYMRPFMVAAHNLLYLKNINGLPVCLGPVLIVDHILNYAKRFLRAFNNYNHFSLLWLNSLTHNDVNAPKALDISIHKFLQELAKIGTYDNAFIMLLSDHGARFGNIRETFLGFLEERLPFMFIWMPKWFREKYPDKYNNLVVNQNRLTSPFDVYVTIKNLLDEFDTGPGPVSAGCPKCTGLLEVQPLDRSCADASIDINWCLCSQFRDIPTQQNVAKDIGMYLYKYIVEVTNDLIARENVNGSLCAKWKFLRVFRVDEIIPANTPQQYSLRNVSNVETERHEYEKISENTKMFVVIIELNPAKTKFESTIRMTLNGDKNPSFALLEPPKRLNSIYKTSKCVENSLLKHYCYCVKG